MCPHCCWSAWMVSERITLFARSHQQWHESCSVVRVHSTWCPRTRPKHSPIIIQLWPGFTQNRMASLITISMMKRCQTRLAVVVHLHFTVPLVFRKTLPNLHAIPLGTMGSQWVCRVHSIMLTKFIQIWNTVTKNGKKSAIFFWPGSEVPIQGMLPTYRYSYNASLPFSKRVDQVGW